MTKEKDIAYSLVSPVIRERATTLELGWNERSKICSSALNGGGSSSCSIVNKSTDFIKFMRMEKKVVGKTGAK